MNVKDVLDENLGKYVKIELTSKERKTGLVEQVSEDYLLIVVNHIIEQIHIQEIQSVTPRPDKI